MAIRTTASGRLLRTTSLLDHEQAYTYAMWLYWAGSVNQAYVLNINEDGVANYDLLGSNSAGNLWLRSHFNSDGDVVGSTLSANTWYHVAMVRESVTSLKAYLNGVLDGTSTLNVTGRGLPVRLDYSGYASGGTSRLDGRGSQFKAWSAALTADELKAEMRSGLPVRWNNLHMFTPLLRHDDVKDYSGAGRDWTTSGTITTEDGPPVTWWPGVAFVEFEVAAAGDTIVGAVGHKAAAVYGSGSLVSASTITDAVGHRSSATYGVGAIVSASTISDAVGHVAGAVFGSGTLMAAPAGTLADTVGHRAGTAYGAGAIVSAGVIAGVVGHVAGTVYGAGAIVSVGVITDAAGHRGGVAYGAGAIVSTSTITNATGHRAGVAYGGGAIVSASTISDATGQRAAVVYSLGTLSAAAPGALTDTVGHQSGTTYGSGAIIVAGVIAGAVGHVAGAQYGAGAIMSVSTIAGASGHRAGVVYGPGAVSSPLPVVLVGVGHVARTAFGSGSVGLAVDYSLACYLPVRAISPALAIKPIPAALPVERCQ